MSSTASCTAVSWIVVEVALPHGVSAYVVLAMCRRPCAVPAHTNAFASVLNAAAAGTAFDPSPLKLPTGMPLKVVKTRLVEPGKQMLPEAMAGVTRKRPRALKSAMRQYCSVRAATERTTRFAPVASPLLSYPAMTTCASCDQDGLK